MNYKNFPAEIEVTLRSLFSDRSAPAFCQLATQNAQGVPNVRTVHVRYLEQLGEFGFNTHVKSAKWKELQICSKHSGCLYLPEKALQVRWRGTATFHLDGASVQTMWQRTREDVRRAYWIDAGEPDRDPKDYCSDFGVVLCQPTEWEVLEINEADYTKERRTRWTLHTENEWKSEMINNLHG